jgi:hypothetical protein
MTPSGKHLLEFHGQHYPSDTFAATVAALETKWKREVVVSAPEFRADAFYTCSESEDESEEEGKSQT